LRIEDCQQSNAEQGKDLDDEFLKLKNRLNIAKSQKRDCVRRKECLAVYSDDRRALENCLLQKVNQLSFDYLSLTEHSSSIKATIESVNVKLHKLMQQNAINDAFHIWYNGPFATINNFRLGTLAVRTIEWSEINTALGQAVLAIAMIAERAQIEFKKYGLIPMGSYPKIYKIEDRRTLYCLYTDGSFSLFPKRKFNLALVGFLYCVKELGEVVSAKDPTLSLPYLINALDGKISNQSVLLGVEDEIWTRSLNFLLADIKWIIAWAAKHCYR
jgi:beclin 1